MTAQIPLIDGVDPTARHAEDFYRTPAWMTRALLRRLPFRGSRHTPPHFLEPCAGDGAIVNVLRARWPHAEVFTNDVLNRRPLVPMFHLDATKRESWQRMVTLADKWEWQPDAVITNPPFSLALPIVQHAVVFAPVVAVLLRLSWLEEPTRDRGPWLVEHPPARVIVLPRHYFRGAGSTDSVTSAWMVWGVTPEPVSVVTTDERDALRAEDGSCTP